MSSDEDTNKAAAPLTTMPQLTHGTGTTSITHLPGQNSSSLSFTVNNERRQNDTEKENQDQALIKLPFPGAS